MDRNRTGISLFLVFLVFLIVFHDCDASLLGRFRKLAGVLGPNKNELSQQISPSPSPAPAPAPAPGPAASVPDPPTDDGMSSERCKSSLKTCHYKTEINITACLISSSNANKEFFVLVQNNGEGSLEVNVTTKNSASQKIQIPKHQIEKVNVSGGRSSSVILNAGNGECVIHLESPVPDGSFFRRFPYYADYVTPRNQAYLLALSVLIFGGTCACCILVKKGRHIDGVPYQELEMGRPESPSVDRVETAERWDHGWDDDWGETKAVRSPRARRNRTVSTNGIASRSADRDGWENDWDD